MSVRYALAFGGLACIGFLDAASSQTWPRLPVSSALAMTASWLALAYGKGRADWLGKRRDGRRAMGATLGLAPYFLLNALIFRIDRLARRAEPVTVVAPGLWLGRRLLDGEMPKNAWVSVLDLAAEFQETPRLRILPRYRSMPVLDATAPTLGQLREAVDWLEESLAIGPTYVHCALGHGRSAAVVIGYWIRQGRHLSIDEAEAELSRLRPGVGLNRDQRSRLNEYARSTICSDPADATDAGA